jgi:ketosteroid isomerase-like protein
MSEMLRILERGYQLIWREDRLEDALRGLGDDFEWIVPDHPEGARRQGPDAAIEFFDDWGSQFDDLEVSWELEDIGAGRALALTSTTGRGRVSGAPVEMRFAQLWTFREGRFVRMVMADTPLLAIARDANEALRREGVGAILPIYTEDVVWEEDPEWPDGQVWHGHEGVRRAFAERFDDTMSLAVDFEETAERGSRVLVLMRWTAEGLGSGASAVLRPAMILDFDEFLISRARFFLDRDRARDAFEAE